jgi:transcriptional regulator with XRE-family HTH domain
MSMEDLIRDIGERLRDMREILKISAAEMAAVTGVSETEYLAAEAGQRDISFTFLYKASRRMDLDMTELLTGEAPHLSSYAVIRKGEGLPISRRRGFSYQNLAYLFKSRLIEPFLVTAPYETGAESADISLNTHDGQEMDYILSGSLRIQIGEHQEILNAGDTVYYDSGTPHGMVAIEGMPCQFMAIAIGAGQK